MNSKHTHHLDPSNLQFSVFSTEDIKKMSVAKIITPLTFDALGHPIPGGLYDPAMGPHGKNSDPCATCLLDVNGCSGHIGHIELIMLVYNPFFLKTAHNLLRLTCLNCYQLQISDHVKRILTLQLQLIDAGYVIEAEEIDIYKSEAINNSGQAQIKTEGGTNLHPKVAEYQEMLLKNPVNRYTNSNINTQTARSTIVNSTIKNSLLKKCLHCKVDLKRVKFSFSRLMISVPKADVISFYEKQSDEGADSVSKKEKQKLNQNQAILAEECRDYFKKIFAASGEFLKMLFPILDCCSKTLKCPTDIFFFDVLPVTPPNVRPAEKLMDRITENTQTTTYRQIIDANFLLKTIITTLKQMEGAEPNSSLLNDTMTVCENIEGSSLYEKMYNAWSNLQDHVDLILDSQKGKLSTGKGLKQIIEKKQGIVRMNMMGKRVNFAARTVITPDPFINVDEIGIPEIFARKLSYPVPVTSWNVQELRKMVMNGPNVHPGANYIERENGFRTAIPGNDEAKRESLAKLLLTTNDEGIKIVHRHLLNNDVLLLNRQPTLHRPGIQAHKTRILKGEKTFRLHYSNCKAYNADFDGDEMNAHCPQNELGRSEAYHLANVANQYLVPKDGTPLGGLIQDHMISGVKITMRGRFFTRDDYQQLVFQGLSHKRGELKLLPPTIIKPVPLWSGKQILSTVMINIIPDGVAPINLTSTAKISSKLWEQVPPRPYTAGGTPLIDNDMTEAEVIIRGGELVVGVLDKTHYGATPYGLIHCMYELYGGDCSSQILSSFARVFTLFLQWEGFTLGVKDILVLPKADKKRSKIIKESRRIGNRIAASALNLPEDVSPDVLAASMAEAYQKDPKFRTVLDRKYKSELDTVTNDINKTCLPAGLISKFPENNLQLMVQSGAKGSTVNTMQISCLLGQIELEGKRPPLMISGRSLPSFSSFETSPKSGGFIDGRFMTGIQPQDFFFHCMAGREGLIDTAVKTSRSGYLQRCLIKHLEGLNVNYDMTVRDSDNSVVQFNYGEDGMDISKSQFLKWKQLRFLDDNCKAIVSQELLKKLENDEIVAEDLRKYMKKLKFWRKRNGNAFVKNRMSSFQQFSKEIRDELVVSNANKLLKKIGRRKIDDKITKLWINSDVDKQNQYRKKCIKCPDPVTTKYKPDNCFGAISEYLDFLMKSYVKKYPSRRKEFIEMINVKSMTSLAAPGEPVGLLAAQSIGEPSTQMTLNTFHFAGRGEMNVTLGIPRLREILMMASSKIKTPSMDIPFKIIPNQENEAEKLRLSLIRVTVADVLESIDVKSMLLVSPERVRAYALRFNFLPKDAYKNDFCIKPNQIIKHMGQGFFKSMFKSILRSAKEKFSVIEVVEDTAEKTKKGTNTEDDQYFDELEPEKVQNENSDDEIEEGDDADATDVRLKARRDDDEKDYEEPVEQEEIDDAFGAAAKEDNPDETKLIVDLETEDGEEDETKVNLSFIGEEANVTKANEFAHAYNYDKEKFLWCELVFHLPMKYKNIDLSTLLREVAKKSVIYEVPQIKRAITYTQNDKLILKTDGINIVEMFKYENLLDLNSLYSNDIHGIAKTYGIEAAGRVIVKEVQNVFKVYGITVDPRHLLLIADYMTFDGTFKPMSRKGMSNSVSPLQQISFESSLSFLSAATISGVHDNLNSPSSRLMVGQPCKSGTGSFTLINDMSFLLKQLV